MDREIKLFSTQIETWGSPLLIRAFDENHAEALTRILFKIPSDVGITATTVEEELEKLKSAFEIRPVKMLGEGDA